MDLVVRVAAASAPEAEREWLGSLHVAAHADDLFRIRLGQQVQGGVDAEHAIAAGDQVLRHYLSGMVPAIHAESSVGRDYRDVSDLCQAVQAFSMFTRAQRTPLD